MQSVSAVVSSVWLFVIEFSIASVELTAGSWESSTGLYSGKLIVSGMFHAGSCEFSADSGKFVISGTVLYIHWGLQNSVKFRW